MDTPARIVMAVYGVLMLGGGLAGYATKHSKPSLIAGLVSAVLLAIACVVSRNNPRAGFGLGASVAVVLIVVFAIRIRDLLAQTPPLSISSNIGLSALSAVVALFLIYAVSRTRG